MRSKIPFGADRHHTLPAAFSYLCSRLPRVAHGNQLDAAWGDYLLAFYTSILPLIRKVGDVEGARISRAVVRRIAAHHWREFRKALAWLTATGDLSEADLAIPTASSSPFEPVELREEIQSILSASDLTPLEREVLFRGISGFDDGEVAEELHIRVTTVQQVRCRAIAKIRLRHQN